MSSKNNKKKPPPIPPRTLRTAPPIPPRTLRRRRGVHVSKLFQDAKRAQQDKAVLVESQDKINRRRRVERVQQGVDDTTRKMAGVASKLMLRGSQLDKLRDDSQRFTDMTKKWKEKGKKITKMQKCNLIIGIILEALPTMTINSIKTGLMNPIGAGKETVKSILQGISFLIFFYFGLNWQLKLITLASGTYRVAVYVCDQGHRRNAEVMKEDPPEGHDYACTFLRDCAPHFYKLIDTELRKRKEEKAPGKTNGGKKNRTKKRRRKSRKRKKKRKRKSRGRKNKSTKKH